MQMESMDSKRNKSKVIIRYYYDRVSRDVGNFFKWIALAIFAGCIKWVTEYRNNNIWVFMILPIVGVAIVFMYQIIDPHDGGTNQVLSTITSRGDVPL